MDRDDNYCSNQRLLESSERTKNIHVMSPIWGHLELLKIIAQISISQFFLKNVVHVFYQGNIE
jgi:hypothetical protein